MKPTPKETRNILIYQTRLDQTKYQTRLDKNNKCSEIEKFDRTKVDPIKILSYGNYATKLEPFFKEFSNFSKIHFVDGTHFDNREVQLLGND